MDSASGTESHGPGRPPILEINNLSKEYCTGIFRKTIAALRDVSFDVPAGTIFALLGPNGSGKTTLIKIVLGLVRPSCGTVRILGQNLNSAVKGRIGFLPDKPHHYAFLSAWETLSFYADVFGFKDPRKKDQIEKVLSLVQMQDQKDLPLRHFSKGMLQRLALAQALLNDPDLLILDEPIGALDPWGVHLMKDIFESMKKVGKTVIFSSHLLSYADQMCDAFVILDKGKLLRQGNLLTDSPGQGLEDIFLSTVPRSG